MRRRPPGRRPPASRRLHTRARPQAAALVTGEPSSRSLRMQAIGQQGPKPLGEGNPLAPRVC